MDGDIRASVWPKYYISSSNNDIEISLFLFRVFVEHLGIHFSYLGGFCYPSNKVRRRTRMAKSLTWDKFVYTLTRDNFFCEGIISCGGISLNGAAGSCQFDLVHGWQVGRDCSYWNWWLEHKSRAFPLRFISSPMLNVLQLVVAPSIVLDLEWCLRLITCQGKGCLLYTSPSPRD